MSQGFDLDEIVQRVADQLLRQCRCAMVAAVVPDDETLVYLLQHRCLVIAPIPQAQALHLAGALRRRLPKQQSEWLANVALRVLGKHKTNH